MFQYDVRIDVAVLPGLVTTVRDPILVDVIEDMLTVAIHNAPACRLLLTAIAEGEEVEVTVIDDLPSADLAYRLGRVKGLQKRVALLGGTLHLAAHSTDGAALSVRLAASPPALAPLLASTGRSRPHSVVGAS